MDGPEKVLVEDWCHQFVFHSVGGLGFDRHGALYASAGDGARENGDYGQYGNACGDPPGPRGSNLTPPSAEGDSLRNQDLRRRGDAVGLSGSIIRVNPDTGEAMPGNPLIRDTDENARRIVAYGLRNAFRFTFRPGTTEMWIGDVGEHISRKSTSSPTPRMPSSRISAGRVTRDRIGIRPGRHLT